MTTDDGNHRIMNNDDYLFVYGTLRRSAGRTDAGQKAFERLVCDASFVAAASMSGQLFEVDGYPGGCYQANADTHILGELYRVDDAASLFVVLDAYEACDDHFSAPQEYRRQRVPIKLGRDEVIHAWAYLYNCPTEHLTIIESGDYLQWQHANDEMLCDIEFDQANRFTNSLPGKWLFWLTVFIAIGMSGFWFLTHTDTLIHFGGLSL